MDGLHPHRSEWPERPWRSAVPSRMTVADFLAQLSMILRGPRPTRPRCRRWSSVMKFLEHRRVAGDDLRRSSADSWAGLRSDARRSSVACPGTPDRRIFDCSTSRYQQGCRLTTTACSHVAPLAGLGCSFGRWRTVTQNRSEIKKEARLLRLSSCFRRTEAAYAAGR
jgi:hypothetical protein